MRHLQLLLLCVTLAGCAKHITVRIPPAVSGEGPQPVLARVQVHDLRTPGVAASTREAAFGVPMGNITFDPPEPRLVKGVLETELTRLMRAQGRETPQDFECDILEFGVGTKATPLYWDVASRVRLALRHGGHSHDLAGEGTARTHVWPGAKIIRSVVDQSLRQVTEELGKVLAAEP